MALIKCYNCGADVSSLATQCPKCGANLQRQEVPMFSNETQPTFPNKTHKKQSNVWKVLAIVFGILLLVSIVLLCLACW